ncbi:uncharacterized protein LOC124656873 [Lolium rigidum]|uniref:uncharacterized protein LOC124656873 n=1 Tax=Lolium rigidum TaxID=89674 RepID=UPI001F5DCC00|nr:uncharacterized protein LOC124656873 [Lolium rigidum]
MACSSKRRGRTTPAGVSSSDASSSWPSMQPDLVRLIGWRLLETGDLLDYVRFRAVCAHWRSSTVCPRGRGVADPRFHPRRWMMLPEGHGLHPGHGKLRKYIRFLNLSTGAIVRSKLPLFSHHCVLDSVDGLLLLQRDQDTAIRLLHPFTGDIAELPPLITLLRQFNFQFSPAEDSPQTRRIWSKFRKVGSTSVSVSADGAITVMIIISGIKCLAIATVGDQQWSVARRNLSFSLNPVSLRGRIYILDHVSTTTQIFQILPPRHDAKVPASSSLPPPPELIATVYRLADLILGRFVPVTSIGDNVLFVSGRILSVSSKVLPNVEGNSLVMDRRSMPKQEHHHASMVVPSTNVTRQRPTTWGCGSAHAIADTTGVTHGCIALGSQQDGFVSVVMFRVRLRELLLQVVAARSRPSCSSTQKQELS